MPPTRRYKVRDASNRLPPQHPNPYTGYNIMNFPYNQTKQRANALSIIPNKTLDLSFEIAKKSPPTVSCNPFPFNALPLAKC